jgi:hypothetical protein
LDVSSTQDELKAVKTVYDRVAELRKLIETEPKDEYKKELEDKEKSLTDRQKAVYTVLTQYGDMAKVILETQGKLLPREESIKQLSDAYRSVGLQKRADSVIDRFSN